MRALVNVFEKENMTTASAKPIRNKTATISIRLKPVCLAYDGDRIGSPSL
jgi:hypothetical protein